MNQSKPKSEIDKDPHFWSSLFQRIGEGESLRKIAKDSKIPKSTLWAWIRNDPQLALRYSEAQQSRAIYHAQRVEELIEKVERGEIDANQARVSIDARKWLSAKFYPKMFSDRYKFDVETRDIGKEHLEALKGYMRSEKVIDVTPHNNN